jgi:hypothetical protein
MWTWHVNCNIRTLTFAANYWSDALPAKHLFDMDVSCTSPYLTASRFHNISFKVGDYHYMSQELSENPQVFWILLCHLFAFWFPILFFPLMPACPTGSMPPGFLLYNVDPTAFRLLRSPVTYVCLLYTTTGVEQDLASFPFCYFPILLWRVELFGCRKFVLSSSFQISNVSFSRMHQRVTLLFRAP